MKKYRKVRRRTTFNTVNSTVFNFLKNIKDLELYSLDYLIFRVLYMIANRFFSFIVGDFAKVRNVTNLFLFLNYRFNDD